MNILQIKQEFTKEYKNVPGFEGAGIGADNQFEFCIRVYVKSENYISNFPTLYKDTKVRAEVVNEIESQCIEND